MVLLLVYVALIAAGTFSAYLLGLVIERNVPSASLVAFLVMYLAVLWMSWILAVRITAPKTERRVG
jgi:hypothetical protein